MEKLPPDVTHRSSPVTIVRDVTVRPISGQKLESGFASRTTYMYTFLRGFKLHNK